jgi:flavin-dependent dehydrogenase
VIREGRGLLRVQVDRRPGDPSSPGGQTPSGNAPSFSVRTSLVIDAEGARPVLAAQLGVTPRRAWVHGLQYEMEGVDLEADDRALAPTLGAALGAALLSLWSDGTRGG